MTDVIMAMSIVSIAIGIFMYLHFRLFNQQRQKLDEQNYLLSQASRAKTEFLSNTSHEIMA